MYCSRRGREVPRPTDTCLRCGRCNWEQSQNCSKAGKGLLAVIVIIGIAILLAAAFLLH